MTPETVELLVSGTLLAVVLLLGAQAIASLAAELWGAIRRRRAEAWPFPDRPSCPSEPRSPLPPRARR